MGRKVLKLGRVRTESENKSVDIKNYETGLTDEGLYYSKHI